MRGLFRLVGGGYLGREGSGIGLGGLVSWVGGCRLLVRAVLRGMPDELLENFDLLCCCLGQFDRW